jgi:hypothetical protein
LLPYNFSHASNFSSPSLSPHQSATSQPIQPQDSTETPFSAISDSPYDSLEIPSSPTSSNESSSHQDTQPDSPSALHQLPQPFLPPSSSTSLSPSLDVPPDRMVTRSQIGHLKPKQYPGFQLFPTIRHPLHALHTCLLPPKPTTFKQAATKPEWVNAMNLEYQALISNKTWSLCPRPPHQMAVWTDIKLG